MSYCRRGPYSDVYLFSTGFGLLCHKCEFAEDRVWKWEPENMSIRERSVKGSTSLEDRRQALRHLEKHIDRGDDVPQKAIDRLERELDSMKE